MDVSIVIVNWNTRNLLLECIKSIREKTAECTYEIIVVDNGSTDGSADAVVNRFPDVTVIRNTDNRGFAAANNAGIGATSGKYVCLVNSDIEVLDGCIDGLHLYMECHPDVGMLGPQILDKQCRIQPSCTELPSLRNTFTQSLCLDRLFPTVRCCRTRFMRDFDHQSERVVSVLSGCCLMIRRGAMVEVGLLDETFFIYKEDVDWCKRFCDAGWQVVFYPGAKAIHYGGASSAAAPTTFMVEMERANQQYWVKHHGWAARRATRAVSCAHYGLRLLGWGAGYVLGCTNRNEAKEMVWKYAACLWCSSGVSRYCRGWYPHASARQQ